MKEHLWCFIKVKLKVCHEYWRGFQFLSFNLYWIKFIENWTSLKIRQIQFRIRCLYSVFRYIFDFIFHLKSILNQTKKQKYYLYITTEFVILHILLESLKHTINFNRISWKWIFIEVIFCHSFVAFYFSSLHKYNLFHCHIRHRERKKMLT